MAICDRCKDPNNLDVHEYTVNKTQFGVNAEPVKQKRKFCDSCAEIERTAGHKLAGGKQEAKPEASTNVREEKATDDQAVVNDKPRRRY